MLAGIILSLFDFPILIVSGLQYLILSNNEAKIIEKQMWQAF